MSFKVGQRVRFDAEFRGIDGKPFDPERITCTIRIERDDGTATADTMSLDNGVQRKRKGLFFAIAVMTDEGDLTVRFDAGKEGGFSVFRDRVGEMAPETGAEDQLADEPSDPAASDASDLEPLTQDAPEPSTIEMVEFLRSRGVAIDATRSPLYVKSMFDAYDGGGSTRADVAETNRRDATDELRRVLAKGGSARENYTKLMRGQMAARSRRGR